MRTFLSSRNRPKCFPIGSAHSKVCATRCVVCGRLREYTSYSGKQQHVSVRYFGWGGLLCGEQYILESRSLVATPVDESHPLVRDRIIHRKWTENRSSDHLIERATTRKVHRTQANQTERLSKHRSAHKEGCSLRSVGKPAPCWIFDAPNVAYSARLLLTFYSMTISSGACPVSSPPVHGTLHR